MNGRLFQTIFAALLLVAAALPWLRPAAAAGPGEQLIAQSPAQIIRAIEVEGIQRITFETVLTYLTVKVGDPFAPGEINNSLKRLFATGFFSSIEMLEGNGGSTLIVRVKENPIINRVAFEGNLRIDDEQLAPEVQIKPRSIYTRSKVQSDVQRILDVYRRSGRFAATVEPKLIRQPQNRVDVVFEVNEGARSQIDRILFVGNQKFSDSELRSAIVTSEGKFWRFWASDDVYDPDRVALDRDALRNFYLDNGYADFRVLSSVAELTPEKTGFVLTFTIEEGERYKFGGVEIESKIPALDANTLVPLVVSQPGEWYNASLVEADTEQLSNRAGDAGFAFVDIRPVPIVDRASRTVAIRYEIGEGPRVYVNRIEISGNVRTEDRVIRREIRLAEGDPFNASKVRRSRQRIQNLGYFETVKVENVQTDQVDRTDIKVEVTEKSTGELSFGAGLSSTDGPLADVSIRERNLLGKGQDLRLSFQVSARSQKIDLAFTEPFFLDRPLSAGFDVFQTEIDNTDESSFEKDSTGFKLRTGYRLSENLRQNWSYGFSADSITVASDASPFIKLSEGDLQTSSLSHTITYDTLDNRFSPRDGLIVSLTNEVAGLGGSERFVRNTIKGGIYQEVLDDVVFSLRAQAGGIVGLGQDTKSFERFYLGGSSFRGFEHAGVGPRDLDTDDAIGGNYNYTATAELSFPIGLPEELGVRGVAFAEAGSVFGLDDETVATSTGALATLASGTAIRASVGVGLQWQSPLGPLRVDLGLPVLKQDHDKTQTLFFSFGTRF